MMGRVTWESLPFPLPGRPNLVLTRDTSYKAKRAEVFTEMREMIGRGYELAGLSGGNEVMLIGCILQRATLLLMGMLTFLPLWRMNGRLSVS